MLSGTEPFSKRFNLLKLKVDRPKWNALKLTRTVFFLLLMVAVSAVAADVPFEPYGGLPTIEDIALSPDGSYLALVKSVKEERILYILSLKNGEVKGACRIGDSKLRGIGWADAEHVLMVVSNTSSPPRGFIGPKSEFAVLLVYDISAETIHNPLNTDISSKDITLNTIIGGAAVRYIDGETIVFVTGIYVQNHRTAPALFKLNLTNGRADFASYGNDKSNGWLLDENGEIMALQTYDNHFKRWTISVRKDRDMTVAASGEAEIEYPTIAGISPAGDAIWIKNTGDGDPTWSPIPFDSGVMGAPLKETQGFRELVVDPYSNQVMGGAPLDVDADIVFFDPKRQAAWETIRNKFPGE